MTGTISLNTQGCSKIVSKNDIVDTNTKIENNITTENKQNEYIDKRNQIIDLNVLNNGEYTNIGDDNRYTLFTGSSIYFKDEWNITDEIIVDSNIVVSVIKTNGIYALVTLPNGTYGYVNSTSLIKCPNLYNNEYINMEEDNIFLSNAYIYDNNGMYIGFVYENCPCTIIKTNGEYSLVTLANDITGYALNSALTNNREQIDGYGYIKSGTNIYSNSTLTNLAYDVNSDRVVQVVYTNGEYAGIFDTNGQELLYIKVSDLNNNFIIIDLDTQRIDCYLDYHIAGTWGTRSGKDSTPTHTGSFDIDWKVENWEFTTYPGNYARHWIPINEYAEGIHDLIGDDEQNYGNEAYHQYGSHGCIRVPAAASQFVYDNYDVGDMVLVRKK